jgi:hypothetical protein
MIHDFISELTMNSSGNLNDQYCLEPDWFSRVDALPKGSKFSVHHYVSAVLSFLPDWRVREVGAIDRKLITHANNPRSPTSKL